MTTCCSNNEVLLLRGIHCYAKLLSSNRRYSSDIDTALALRGLNLPRLPSMLPLFSGVIEARSLKMDPVLVDRTEAAPLMDPFRIDLAGAGEPLTSATASSERPPAYKDGARESVAFGAVPRRLVLGVTPSLRSSPEWEVTVDAGRALEVESRRR